MSRQDKINHMVNSVETWEPQTVIDYLQEWLERSFGDMTDEQINEEYSKWFDENNTGTIKGCACDLLTLMSSGCVCGGK